jgi:hypothetical protein
MVQDSYICSPTEFSPSCARLAQSLRDGGASHIICHRRRPAVLFFLPTRIRVSTHVADEHFLVGCCCHGGQASKILSRTRVPFRVIMFYP